MMLTTVTPDHFDWFFVQHSLVGRIQACGFHTLWISNQGKFGEYDSFCSALAIEANEQIFLNELSWTNMQYDEAVIDELDAHGVFAKRDYVTFVHLSGSHTRYNQR